MHSVPFYRFGKMETLLIELMPIHCIEKK